MVSTTTGPSLGGSPFTRRGRVWYNPYTAVVLMECNNCRSLTRHRPLANQNIVSHAIIRNVFCKNFARVRIAHVELSAVVPW